MINHAGQIKGDMGSELFLACQNSHFSVWPMGKPVSDTGVRMVCSENKYVMLAVPPQEFSKLNSTPPQCWVHISLILDVASCRHVEASNSRWRGQIQNESLYGYMVDSDCVEITAELTPEVKTNRWFYALTIQT